MMLTLEAFRVPARLSQADRLSALVDEHQGTIGMTKAQLRCGHRLSWAFAVERMTGIEPAFSAWEADVLPLNYIRAVRSQPSI
jgi:hypothetical protein